MEIKITKEFDGMILRDFLTKELKISHRLLVSLKADENGILLDGKHVTVRAILHEGALLRLATEDKKASDILPVKLDFEILYEDEDILAVSKPPFMPTHPSINHYDDTLANGISYYYKEKGESTVFRPITRLDRNTSGVVLTAKNARAAACLAGMMQSGMIAKTYTAITEGITPEEFTVEAPICRRDKSIILRSVCEEGEGQYAKTEFKKIACANGMSVLKVTPLTGRTHQIRVHLAHAGFPLVGDELYGSPSELIPRHALHAKRLVLTYPDGKRLCIEAPLAEDMKFLSDMCGNMLK